MTADAPKIEPRLVGGNRGMRWLGSAATYVLIIGASLLKLAPFVLAVLRIGIEAWGGIGFSVVDIAVGDL
jgi:hypothetical protein